MVPVYSDLRYELQEWPLEKFYAIDLFAFLESLPAEKMGRGDYLIVTNVRNEKQFWKREQIEPYKPVIVIGLDDEKNLFRLGVFYRANLEYSWKSGPQPPMMARPLGAFIHFLKEPPDELAPQPAQYGLTPESFRLAGKDPLASLRGLRKDIYEAMTYRNGCVYCHSFRGIDSRSHHVIASTGAPHGGFALPLPSYPAEVWKSFIFDQNKVANKIGASEVAIELAEAGLPVLARQRSRTFESNTVAKIAWIEICLAVTFAREGEHGVGARFHSALDHARKVNSQERKRRVRHGVNQVSHQEMFRRRKRVVFTAKRNDSVLLLPVRSVICGRHHVRDNVGVETTAI